MAPSPFHMKKRRSALTYKRSESSKGDFVKPNTVVGNEMGALEQPSLHREYHAGNTYGTVRGVKNVTPSLKLCKKWLIGELKRVKKENIILKSHLHNPSDTVLVLNKQTHCNSILFLRLRKRTSF
uniref:Uncharacterized protein n=1 Tax=Cacopsylla melanoneura TaxID=428564 RepID=A0A8D8Z300_9HEMI